MNHPYHTYEPENNQQPTNTYENTESFAGSETGNDSAQEGNSLVSETLPRQAASSSVSHEAIPEIDPIYQNVPPISPTGNPGAYSYSPGYTPAGNNYTNSYQSQHPQTPRAEEEPQPTQGNPYFTAKPVADKQTLSYQEVKEKRKKRGRGFRNFVAMLALIGIFYGTYTLGAYQAEQRMDNKLAEIRAELDSHKELSSQLPPSSGSVQPAQSSEGESKASAIPPVVSNPSASPVVAIADRVAPSVVTITATISSRSSHTFFESFPQTYKGSGSGILYKKDSDNLYVITNHHVIENGSDIKVTFYDGESSPAEVIGYDSRNDLAVLKIKLEDVKNKNVTLATFGDSTKLKVGQLAVAIGNPLGEGHDHTITAGVISSVNRSLDIENIKNLEVIQTDAAINPGNSGGALVNEYGEVIGINTAKYLDVKVEGMGFAIPSSVAIPVVEKILKNGNGDAAYAISDDRPFLGIGFSGITSDVYAKTGVPFGVYVTKVYAGSAAAKAGVEEGDILFSLNGVRIKDANMLFDSIGKLNLGDNVKIGLVRNDKVFEVEAVITSFGEVNAQNGNQLNQKPTE